MKVSVEADLSVDAWVQSLPKVTTAPVGGSWGS